MLPFAILVFDLAGGHESVRMVDASRADCFEHGSRGRRQLVGVDELLDEVLAATPSACSTTVTVKTLLANDASLQVKRYFLSAREKGIKRYFDNAPAARLGDLVEIVSPIRGNAGMGETVTLHEVGVGDLPATGFIQHTSRVVPLDAAVAARKRTQFLRPGDLLLAVRRSGIDIGVTPPIIPASDAIGWIAGRAFTVLRALSGVPLDMRALAMFLRSPLGEELLRQLFAGCEVLQPKRLLELTFPTFNRDSERSAITAWDAEVTIQHDVDECLRRQSAIRRGLWPLDD